MNPVSQLLAFELELRTQAELLSIQYRVVTVLGCVWPDEEKSRLHTIGQISSERIGESA